MKTITLSANTAWYLYNFRASTIRALGAAGYRVVCLAPPDGYGPRLAELGCEWRALPMDNAGHNPLRELALLLRLARHYGALRPVAAFHFTVKNNVYGTLAARALGVPVVNNVSGLGTAFIRAGWVARVVRGLYRVSQPLAWRVFCQNAEDLELLRAHRLVPAARLALLPGSGVDLRRFHPALRHPRAPGEPLRLLYAGRMLADKGLRELVEAVVGINRAGAAQAARVLGTGGEGMVAGTGGRADGPLRCTLDLCGFAGAGNVSAIPEETLQEWGRLPGIRWLGPSDAMPEVYARADVVVLPSYREGMPRSLLEAGAMGLPAVATDVPGCRHVVRDGVNGFLCEVRSAGSLRAALERVLAVSDAGREHMGAAARARVEAEFGEERVVEAALEVVREIEARRG